MVILEYVKLAAFVALPVAAGILFRKNSLMKKAPRLLFSIALFCCQTPIALLAVWVADLGGSLILPFIALAGWLLAAASGRLGSSLFRHTRPQRGAFIMTICMSNHGYTLLGFVAVMLFHEHGLAQATWAQLLFVPFMILVCFPLGRFYGNEGNGGRRRHPVAESVLDPRNVPLIAMTTGILLNLAGIPRPPVLGTLTTFLVYAGTIVSGLAIGLQFTGLHVKEYRGEIGAAILFRLTVYPAFFYLASRFFRLGSLDTKILFLYGLVPSAVFSNLVAELFGLDRRMTNTVFIVSTFFFLVVVLPVFVFLHRYI